MVSIAVAIAYKLIYYSKLNFPRSLSEVWQATMKREEGWKGPKKNPEGANLALGLAQLTAQLFQVQCDVGEDREKESRPQRGNVEERRGTLQEVVTENKLGERKWNE